jgi:1-acyl-sn-glycerol-3-phosphate acyltransferase
MIGKHLRTFGRLIGFAWVIGLAVVQYAVTVWLAGKSSRLGERAAWMARTSRRLLAVLNIQVTRHGLPPVRGLVAANHLGYIDIVVLGAAQPTIFLSKSEVRQWPIFGPLAAWAGTLFIRRDRKADVARFDEAFARVVQEGVILGIFPEGTSSDGHRVLPFHSSLFAAAAAAQWPVTPVWIGYEVDNRTGGGTVENDVSYWGEMTFGSHFLRLVQLEQVRATVVYGRPLQGVTDRKELARVLHRQVCGLKEQYRPTVAGQGMAGERDRGTFENGVDRSGQRAVVSGREVRET